MHDVPALSRRIAALDAMFSEWVMKPAERERLQRVQSALAERGIGFDVGSRLSLPSSVLRRALLLEGAGAKTAVLFGDADKLASVCAVPCTVVAADAVQKSVIADIAVIEASEHPLTAARLESALAAVGPSGTVVARVRWPWDRAFYEHIRIMGLKIIGYERDCDHTLLPGAHVLDGGGDLVILSGAIGATAPALPEQTSDDLSKRLPTSVDVPPYAWFDMDGITGEGTLKNLADEVVRLSKRTPDLSDVKTYENRDVLCWYDVNGHGFVAELNRELSHLLVSYPIYDDVLDHATLTAAFAVFADDDTRVRPRRTERTPDRPVFA